MSRIEKDEQTGSVTIKTMHLDPNESKGLLLTHISTRAELDRWEQENIVEAIELLVRTKPTEILNEQFIKKLHKMMFKHVWSWAVDFRISDKNIGGQWFQISTSLKMLCDNTLYKIERQIQAPDELAIRFHHNLFILFQMEINYQTHKI